jgi:lipopolysaccharide export system permease protein
LNTLDRHILREWLKILGLVLAAALGLLLMQQMYDDFGDLLDAGAGAVDIAMYYTVLMPSFLIVVLPLAVLVSLLYSLGQLHRHNEFTVMRAAGLSLFRLTRGIWVVGLLGSGLMWLLNAQVVPWSVEESRRIKESLEFRHEARTGGTEHIGLVTSVAFDNRTAGRLWYINRYSRFAGRAYGVTVSVLDGRRREMVRYLARQAHYDPASRSWTFFDGDEIQFDLETGDMVRLVPFAERRFADFHEDPQLLLLIDRDPLDLSFRELRRIIDYLHVEGNPKVTKYAIRYYRLLADTLGCLIVIGIAIPFAVSGVRVSPAVGVSKSLGLFFVYYLLVSFASMLAGRGLLTPEGAAWMPNLAMAALATWLFGRLR